MNRDEILNMPAGREMDALIAEKVMKLSTNHLPVVYEEGYTEDGTDGWSGFVCPRCRRPKDMLDEPCTKYYSTDIAAAWEVLEKINAIPYDEDGYQAHMRCSHELKGFEYLSARDAALRICRATLLAVMDAQP